LAYNETDLAYLAGFIDADGSLEICHGHKERKNISSHAVAKMCLVNTNRECLENIQRIFNRMGNLRVSQRRAPFRDCYILDFRKDEMKELIPKILPYLKLKQKQAKLLLYLFSLLRTPTRTFSQTKRDLATWALFLNKRGIRNDNYEEKLREFYVFYNSLNPTLELGL